MPNSASAICLLSPDQAIELSFRLAPAGPKWEHEQDCPYYRVTHRGRVVAEWSRLGLELGGAAEFNSGFKVVEVQREEQQSSWQPIYGERAEVRDAFRQMRVILRETIPPHRTLWLEFRCYPEGAAFRYVVPEQEGIADISITREKTEFVFPEHTEGYVEYHVEGEYQRLDLTNLDRPCERPLTLAYADGGYACLHEAACIDFSRMLLAPLRGRCGVTSALSGTVRGTAPFGTPWRVFIVGDRPGDLLERNDLIRNLNEPCAIEDTSWIKPGKTIREVTLSTAGGIACVDFAVARGLDYIHYDAGWYGHEYMDRPDARKVALDPLRVGGNPEHGGLDLPRVVEYATSKGIGVWLYVNRRHLERQMDELLPLYESWGIKGIKPGFVQVGPQEWTRWLHDLVRQAAKHHLMVDVHDGYRPTGFSRTYPNFLTQEGVRGNEHMPTSRHNCTLPFCRYPAGAADYTPCYYNERVKNTHAHQLALPVVFYSPAMYLFWYDQPAAYQGEPEVEFWHDLPTVWDETNVLMGEIGEYVSVARRTGATWYIGTITNENGRDLEVPLGFLDQGIEYDAFVCADGDSEDSSRTHVAVRSLTLGAADTIHARLAAHGGQGVRLVPKRHG
jgi:alpha-glucosidase